MNKTTKIALAAGALALAGAAGFATFAAAGHGKGGWRQASAGHHWRGHHGRGHRIERMLERFDADKDGKLTQKELDEGRTGLLGRHDADKDGKLSLAEFEKLWLEVMRKRLVRGFQRLDADGDTEVTLDEFLKPFAHLVERMDGNEDGAIGRDDRKRHQGRHRGGNDERMHRRGSYGPDRG